MAWNDNLSKAGLQMMRENRRPCYRCPPWMQNAFKNAALTEPGSIEGWDWDVEEWTDNVSGDVEDWVYRLAPEQQRPEPEPEEWIYCEVRQRGDEWWVYGVPCGGHSNTTTDIPLDRVDRRIGCGGLEFKEKPGAFYGDGHIRYVMSNGDLTFFTDRKDLPLATPNRVRYHRPTLVKHGIIPS